MDDPRGNPLVELFNQVIFESFFNVLRTQEQLGMLSSPDIMWRQFQ